MPAGEDPPTTSRAGAPSQGAQQPKARSRLECGCPVPLLCVPSRVGGRLGLSEAATLTKKIFLGQRWVLNIQYITKANEKQPRGPGPDRQCRRMPQLKALPCGCPGKLPHKGKVKPQEPGPTGQEACPPGHSQAVVLLCVSTRKQSDKYTKCEQTEGECFVLTNMPRAAWCIHSPTRTWPPSWPPSWPLSWPPSGPAQSVCTNHHEFLRNGNSAICFQPTMDLHPQGLLLRPPGVTDSSAGPNRRPMMAGLPSRTRHVLLPSCEPSPACTPGTVVSAEVPTHPDRRGDPRGGPPRMQQVPWYPHLSRRTGATPGK